MYGASEGVQG